MNTNVRWTVTVDTVTDALVSSHLATCRPSMTLDAFVTGAINREFDRLAQEEHDRPTARAPGRVGICRVVVPRPQPA